MSDEFNQLAARIKELAETMGKTPTKNEAIASGISHYVLKKHGFEKLLNVSGMISTKYNRNKIDIQEMVNKVKEIHLEIGRVPTRADCVDNGILESRLNSVGYRRLMNMVGIEDDTIQDSLVKILIFDIETAPILAHVWGLFDQNIGLNQISKDWHVLSWSAKWLDSDEVFYRDQRDSESIEEDRDLLLEIWRLLDEADIVITQNGIKFDSKKLNARFILNGIPPTSSYRHIDTLRIAKKHFSFTSNKLEYMTDKLCVKYKKLDHKKFSGFSLWSECLKGNLEAWEEMKLYNQHDVLALEELYLILRKWENGINLNVFSDSLEEKCSCGSSKFIENGLKVTNTGKFTRFKCLSCGAERSSKVNLLTKEKKKSLKEIS